MNVLYQDFPSDAQLAKTSGPTSGEKDKRRKLITETIIINLLIISESNDHHFKITKDHFI